VHAGPPYWRGTANYADRLRLLLPKAYFHFPHLLERLERHRHRWRSSPSLPTNKVTPAHGNGVDALHRSEDVAGNIGQKE